MSSSPQAQSRSINTRLYNSNCYIIDETFLINNSTIFHLNKFHHQSEKLGNGNKKNKNHQSKKKRSSQANQDISLVDNVSSRAAYNFMDSRTFLGGGRGLPRPPVSPARDSLAGSSDTRDDVVLLTVGGAGGGGFRGLCSVDVFMPILSIPTMRKEKHAPEHVPMSCGELIMCVTCNNRFHLVFVADEEKKMRRHTCFRPYKFQLRHANFQGFGDWKFDFVVVDIRISICL